MNSKNLQNFIVSSFFVAMIFAFYNLLPVAFSAYNIQDVSKGYEILNWDHIYLVQLIKLFFDYPA